MIHEIVADWLFAKTESGEFRLQLRGNILTVLDKNGDDRGERYRFLGRNPHRYTFFVLCPGGNCGWSHDPMDAFNRPTAEDGPCDFVPGRIREYPMATGSMEEF